MYQNFTIPYLYEAQHISGDTPPIIRSALAASGFAYVEGCRTCGCWTLSNQNILWPDSVQQLHVQKPSMYTKPEAASAVLGF
jgi:hypothetical protein